MIDRDGENRAAAAAAGLARRKWREAQMMGTPQPPHGPMDWVRISERLPAYRQIVLHCTNASFPPVQTEFRTMLEALNADLRSGGS